MQLIVVIKPMKLWIRFVNKHCFSFIFLSNSGTDLTVSSHMYKCTSSYWFAGAPTVMFVNVYAGELPIRKMCNFNKPLNNILKEIDGCYAYILPCKHQNTHDEDDRIAMQSVRNPLYES